MFLPRSRCRRCRHRHFHADFMLIKTSYALITLSLLITSLSPRRLAVFASPRLIGYALMRLLPLFASH